jgi:hypothetical protein
MLPLYCLLCAAPRRLVSVSALLTSLACLHTPASGQTRCSARIVIEPQYEAVGSFSEGLAAVQLQGLWGFVNVAGKLVVPARFTAAGAFHQGRAQVLLSGHWGYVNAGGKIAIQYRFDAALPFSEGLAAVRENGKWGYVDTMGQFVIKPQYEDARPFREGLAAAAQESRWGLIGPDGQWRLAAKYDAVQSTNAPAPAVGMTPGAAEAERLAAQFYEGRLTVSDDYHNAFLDPQGKLIKPATPADDILGYSEGLAAFQATYRWGFLALDGKVAIAPTWDQAQPFAQGLAAVERQGIWGYITKTGKLAIPMRYDRITPFESGMAAVRLAGTWQLIDRQGTTIPSPKFEEASASGASEGFLGIRQGNHWGFLLLACPGNGR